MELSMFELRGSFCANRSTLKRIFRTHVLRLAVLNLLLNRMA